MASRKVKPELRGVQDIVPFLPFKLQAYDSRMLKSNKKGSMIPCHSRRTSRIYQQSKGKSIANLTILGSQAHGECAESPKLAKGPWSLVQNLERQSHETHCQDRVALPSLPCSPRGTAWRTPAPRDRGDLVAHIGGGEAGKKRGRRLAGMYGVMDSFGSGGVGGGCAPPGGGTRLDF